MVLLLSVGLIYALEDGHERYIGGKATIDNTKPIINIISPTNHATVYKSRIDIEGEYIESHLSEIRIINLENQYNNNAKIIKKNNIFRFTNIPIIDGTNKFLLKVYDQARNKTEQEIELFGLLKLIAHISVTQDNEVNFGDLKVIIPKGVAPCDADLEINIINGPHTTNGIMFISDTYSIKPINVDGEFCFTSNVLMTFNYDDTKLPEGFDENTLNIYLRYRDLGETNWNILQRISIDTQLNTISAIVPCFSMAAVGGSPSYNIIRYSVKAYDILPDNTNPIYGTDYMSWVTYFIEPTYGKEVLRSSGIPGERESFYFKYGEDTYSVKGVITLSEVSATYGIWNETTKTWKDWDFIIPSATAHDSDSADITQNPQKPPPLGIDVSDLLKAKYPVLNNLLNGADIALRIEKAKEAFEDYMPEVQYPEVLNPEEGPRLEIAQMPTTYGGTHGNGIITLNKYWLDIAKTGDLEAQKFLEATIVHEFLHWIVDPASELSDEEVHPIVYPMEMNIYGDIVPDPITAEKNGYEYDAPYDPYSP